MYRILALFFCVAGISALRLMSYHIPSVIDFRDEASLFCQFDTEGQQLHSVRWYLNGTEFYKATPSGNNDFHYIDGVSVRAHKSNITTVVLGPLYFTTSGEFRCEAMTAPPLYRTLAITKRMLVVALPKEGPSIEGIHPNHSWGTKLDLNCTSAPSYPPANIYWTINNVQLPEDVVTQYYPQEEDGLRIRSTKAGLTLQTELLPFGDQNEVTVTCVAIVPGIYKNMVNIRLAKAQAVKRQ